MKKIFRNTLFIAVSLFNSLFGQLAAFDHSHSTWDSLLKKNVTNSGKVNYPAFQKNAAFNKYLHDLSAVTLVEYSAYNRNQKMAFLINAYNAFTIKLIIDHYPVKSIRKIGGLLTNPWKIEFFTLLGKKRHLDYIEHGVLRPNFGDARIHAAVVCASKGCPPLLNEAFTGKKLNAQLETRMKNFLNDSYYNQCSGSKANLSSIFKWYKKDFGGEDKLPAYLSRYNPSCSQVKNISYKDYDWSLNSK